MCTKTFSEDPSPAYVLKSMPSPGWCLVIATAFFFFLTACNKTIPDYLDENNNGNNDTAVNTGGNNAGDSVFLLAEISGNDMPPSACEYDPITRKLSKLYFTGHASGDTTYFGYDAHGNLSYVIRKDISLFDGKNIAHIFRHDLLGRISKVYYVYDSPPIIDTNNLLDVGGQGFTYDSVVYDSKDRIARMCMCNNGSMEGFYEFSYQPANDSLLSKVVYIQPGIAEVHVDSIEFTGYTHTLNPYYRDFQFYPYQLSIYRITFLPYGHMQEFMVFNKYLCSTVKLSDADATKYVFYTYDANGLPVRYFIGLYSWDANGLYENYTACAYLKTKK